MRLRIPRAVAAALVARARAEAPREACGVLLGRLDEARVVEREVAVRNVAPRPEAEYALDPQGLLEAVVAAEERLGLDVVGFWHSHPAGPAGPSATDAARATWEGASHVVVWLGPREGLGSWRLERGRLAPEDVELVSA